MSDLDSKSYLLETMEAFEKATEQAVALSERRLGVAHTGRQNRVLMAYAKTLAHAMSIQLIYRNSVRQKTEFGFLDHFSIGTLTRTLIDASIMTLYLSYSSEVTAQCHFAQRCFIGQPSAQRKRGIQFLIGPLRIALI